MGEPVAESRQAETRRVSQLVVIGASAGGVDALAALVATLPADLPAPIVIAQHLAPTRPSHLGEILASRSPLPVRTVTGQEKLRPGVVYVVPADRDVEISDHSVGVRVPEAQAPKPSVDRLMATAARVFAEDLIAVVLTGTGADGAAGAQGVKALGGTVIVQNPATAAFAGMPLAVPPSAIDVVADLDAIGPLLGDLLSGAYIVPPPAPTTSCAPSSTGCASAAGSTSPPTSGRRSCAGSSGGWPPSAPPTSPATVATWSGIRRKCSASSPPS